jgi:hypothetical protein
VLVTDGWIGDTVAFRRRLGVIEGDVAMLAPSASDHQRRVLAEIPQTIVNPKGGALRHASTRRAASFGESRDDGLVVRTTVDDIATACAPLRRGA